VQIRLTFAIFYEKNSPKLQYEKNEKKDFKGEICIQKLELLNKILCTVLKIWKNKNATLHQ
jgi:hypothetical protein